MRRIFSELSYLSFHFDNDFAHLEIGPFTILSIHVDLCDKSDELVGDINIGYITKYAFDFSEVGFAFGLVGEYGVPVLERGCTVRLTLLLDCLQFFVIAHIINQSHIYQKMPRIFG